MLISLAEFSFCDSAQLLVLHHRDVNLLASVNQPSRRADGRSLHIQQQVELCTILHSSSRNSLQQTEKNTAQSVKLKEAFYQPRY